LAVLTSLALAGLGLLAWPTRGGLEVIERVERMIRPAGIGSDGAGLAGALGQDRSVLRARLAAGGAGVVVALLVPSLPGYLAAAGLAVALNRVLRRMEPAAVRRARTARLRDLPATLDLLGVALRAGLPIDQAIDVVAAANDGPLSADMRRVAAATRLGSGPVLAWEPLDQDVVWGPVARAVRRSAASGSALADAFERVAQDRRGASAQHAESAARQASVIAMAPLGLCFLPAFICIGVVPVIVGLLAGALS
jgi:Flp pilus assembly protein TadB